MSSAGPLPVVVIGAGVIGITTALALQTKGHKVLIIAQHLPGDPKTIGYTSPWAGAHHVSSASPDDIRLHEFDKEGFEVMRQMMADDPDAPLRMRPQREYRDFERTLDGDGLDQLALLARIHPDFRMLEPDELPPGVVHGATFTTINIDVPRYLPYIHSKFLAADGLTVRATLPPLNSPDFFSFSHPDFPSSLPSLSDAPAIFNCTGLAARAFVPDPLVHPVRGQVVVVRAPWVSTGITAVTKDQHLPPHYRGYVIPRNETDVVVGGTSAPDDWEPQPREKVTRLILERGLAMCPELVAPEKREGARVEDIEVLEVGVGLRPAREGGIRLDVEKIGRGDNSVRVVHNYGHGGYGYQSSFGSARWAVELFEQALVAN